MICLKCLSPISDQPHYGLHEACFKQWFAISNLAEFSSLQRQDQAPTSQDTSFSNNSFFHGAFKKYSANLGSASYILKMRQAEAPELPEVEYVCNQIAQRLNIPVAEYYLMDFQGDRVFVTKNFIRPSAPIDLQHIYHFRANEHHTCEHLIQVIAEKTHSPHDVHVFLKTVLFDALIGNHDRHGRNLAFIVTAKGSRLAPIYDNVSYLALEQGVMLKADFNPSGKIATTTTQEPSMKDYALELKRLSYQDIVLAFYRSLQLNLNKLDELVNQSFCSDLMKTALNVMIHKRVKELADVIAD